MLCPACSTDIAADSAFCPNCGHRLNEPAATPATRTPAEKFRAGERPTATDDPEQQLWQGTYSPKAMYGKWLFAAVLTLGRFILSLFLAPVRFITPAIVPHMIVLIFAALWTLVLRFALLVALASTLSPVAAG
jgi:hypothetical protein